MLMACLKSRLTGSCCSGRTLRQQWVQFPGSPGAAEIARLKRHGGYEPGLAWMESLVPSENKLPPSDHFSRGL